ncbi:MAG: GAF domain-containing sensor histidine kinase, partial [Chloroflexota bacterium]|nr:GAF domain-containing sensor histidine kinase [Chloroflexota bacterium]
NETRQLVCLAHRGPFPWCSAELDGQRMGDKLFQLATEDAEAVVIPELEQEVRVNVRVPESGQLRQALSVPLRLRGQTIGAMNLCGDDGARFSSENVRLLNLLAIMAALAIENAYIYREADARARLRRLLLAREIKVQEEERRRIARELHDEVGQSLTGLIMSLDTIDQALLTNGREQADDLVRDYLSEARQIAAGTLQEIRRVIFDLRPTLLDDLGLAAAVDWYAKTSLAKAGIAAAVKASGLDNRLPPKVEVALYRIVQEAVVNVIKHAYAHKCTVRMAVADGEVETVIEDDGRGFDPGKIGRAGEEHLGIVGMQERARSLGGQCTIHSRPGEGTHVHIRIPLPAGGAEQ